MKRKNFILVSMVLAIGYMLAACNHAIETYPVHEGAKSTRSFGDKTPIVSLYVEVNDVDPRNAGAYTIGTEPFFDIVIIFAANIHADTDGDPCLFLNDNVNHILSNVDKYVKPLQAKGIKVILGVLGDHKGIGVSNLTPTQAQSFAEILAYAVETYGLDGIDFDDEYARYGINGFPTWNITSYSNLIKALRAEMPAGKLITVLEYVADTGGSTHIDSIALSKIDYAWYRYMGPNNFGYSSIEGMPASKWSPQLLNLNVTYNFITLPLIQSRSRQAKIGGYGAITTYDLRPASERSGTLTVLQRIATGVEFGTVEKTEDDYPKDWYSGGTTKTITKNDIIN